MKLRVLEGLARGSIVMDQACVNFEVVLFGGKNNFEVVMQSYVEEFVWLVLVVVT